MSLRAAALAVALVALLPATAAAHVTALQPDGTRAAVRGDERPGRVLPDRLVIAPGRYEGGGQSYELTRGAYRLGQQRRIVFDGSARSLLSGIAWFTNHNGTDPDNGLSYPAMAQAMMHRRLDLICGSTSLFAIWLGAQHGLTMRETGFAAPVADRQVEVRVGGAWQMYDLDGLFNFRPLVNGKSTTVVRFVQARRSELSFDWVASDAVHAFYADRPIPEFSRTENEMLRYHARNSFGWPGIPAGVFPWEQYRRDITPVVLEDGYKYFFRTRDREALEASSPYFRWIPRAQFMAKFYG